MSGFGKKFFFYTVALIIAVLLIWLSYVVLFFESPGFRNTPPAKPDIISRATWHARPLNLGAPEEYGLFDARTNPEGVLVYPDDLQGVLNTIVIHHTAYPYAGPTEIQNLHMESRGFADVAYHFIIDSEGFIYEGREINIRGAHVQGFNTGSVGIALLGDFNLEKPPDSQLTSLRMLVDYLRYTYEIHFLAGHKDYPNQSPDGTECPGANLYPLLPELARGLGMKYGIEGYVPPEWAR